MAELARRCNGRRLALSQRKRWNAAMTMIAGRAVAHHFSADEAEVAARTFDLKRLPTDFIDDPFPYYRALREHDPVHRMPDGAYLLTRWRDCDAVYRDARTFSSDKKVEFFPKYGDAPLYRHHTTSLVFNDPPLRTHVRRAIQGALSNRVIAEMEAGLVALVDRLIAAMAEKGGGHHRGLRVRDSRGNHRQPARRAAAGSQGTLVTLCIGAANRDGEPFPDPNRFDVGRNPSRHLAFGSGIHMCAGMSLARLEGRIAIERFLERFPDYEPDGAPMRSRRARFRGFTALPVRVKGNRHA
jgi:cytochrome P450